MRVNIDGDIAVYRVGFASQGKNLKGEPEAIPTPLAKARMDKWLEDVLKATNAKSYKVYLTSTDHSNYRYALYPEYKANRKQPKPLLYNELREHLINIYPTMVVFGQEADDQLGIDQTPETILASIDKDLDQIPGKHYDFVKDIMYDVTPETAFRFFYYQLLMGDATDNIPGIPGCGPKTAQKLLEGVDPKDMPQAVYDAYEAHYGESLALKQMTLMGQLLWIRKKEGEELWQPPPNLHIEVALSDSRQMQFDDLS